MFLVLLLLFFADLHAQSVLSSAAQRIQGGDARSAASMLDIYLKNNPADAAAWNLLGIAHTEAGNGVAADQAFLRALKLQPSSAAIAENYGSSLFRRGEYARAKTYLQTALKSSGKPEVAFQFAVARMRSGDAESGFRDLLKIEAAMAGHPAYWEERGIAEAGRKQNDAARRSLERSLELQPQSPRALSALAALAEQARDDERALAYLVKARALDPQHPGLALAFGRICLRRDLVSDALGALEQASAAMPDNAEALYSFAAANLAAEKFGRARDLLLKFTARVPKHPTAQYSLGWLALKLNDTAEARARFEAALKLEPAYAAPMVELAELDLQTGNLEAAEAHARKAAQLDSASARPFLVMGDIAARRNQLADARTHYEKAIAVENDSGAAHAKLARALFRLGDKAGAEREQRVAAEANEREKLQRRRELRLAGVEP